MNSPKIVDLVNLNPIKSTQKSGNYSNSTLTNLSLQNIKLNQILAGLHPTALENLNEHLELVLLPVGKMLFESGEKIQHVYFPVSCIVSLHHVLESGGSTEVAGVGNEGMVGISSIIGTNRSMISAMVLISGYAYKLKASRLVQMFNDNLTVQIVLLRYIQKLMSQIGQNAACNRHHTIHQQLCRWLLLTLDRLSNNELRVTQDLVANALGVRRGSVTVVAVLLQRESLISYRRGHITVLDRTGLEHHACECYFIIRNEFDLTLKTT